MIHLNVFEQYEIVSDKNTLRRFRTAWPIMIVAYIIVEHNRKIDINQLCNLFYPLVPLLPNDSLPVSQAIYEKLWNYVGKREVNSVEIENTFMSQFSDDDIIHACEQLKQYRIIQTVEQRDNYFFYTLPDNLRKAINSCHIDADKIYKNKRTILQNIDYIKKHFRLYSKLIYSQHNLLVVIFDSNIIQLETALLNNDFEKIKEIYRGPFLHNIEDDIRATVWLSPMLHCWLQSKRCYFAERVATALVNLLTNKLTNNKLSERQRLILAEEVKNFCQQSQLNNTLLNNTILNLQASSSNSEIQKSEQPKKIQPMDPKNAEESIFPPEQDKYFERICTHLTNKTNDYCESQLKLIAPNLIDLHLSIQKLNGDSTQQTYLLYNTELLQFIRDKCYNLAILLGEAGSGKSFALYHFAKQLVAQNEQWIPLIFHFADWAKLDFEMWLKHELIELGLPKNSINQDFELLLRSGRIVLLLDGFDNILNIKRFSALHAINHFIKSYGEIELNFIITSRPDEYFLSKAIFINENTTLHFYAEATIKTLDQARIRAYLQQYFSNISLVSR